MIAELFEDLVKEIDRKFSQEKRQVALIVDNCTAHPFIEHLKSVSLIFLPPNTTSKTQPMDQGVIRSLKAKYKKMLVWKYISALETQMDFDVMVLVAMIMLNAAWQDITDKCITNCFRKAGT